MRGGAGADALLKGLGVAAAISFGSGALATIILAFTFATTTRGDQCMEGKTTTSARPPLEGRLGFHEVGSALNPGVQKPGGAEAPVATAPSSQAPAAEAPASATAQPAAARPHL